VRDNLEPEVRGRNCEESCENDGAVESQQQAFHRSLEISQTEIPTFSQLRRRRFLRHDRRLKTTKTETVYTKTFTPPRSISIGASLFPPCFRFHTPLIEPDVRICRIRLSEKTHAIAVAIACDVVCNF
jgi:hypothetical protein